MNRIYAAIATICIAVMVISGTHMACAPQNPPTTQPSQQQVSLALEVAYIAVEDAVALGVLPASDGPIATAAYNAAQQYLVTGDLVAANAELIKIIQLQNKAHDAVKAMHK